MELKIFLGISMQQLHTYSI